MDRNMLRLACNNFLFLVVSKGLIFGAALAPLAWVLAAEPEPLSSRPLRALSVLGALLLAPILSILLAAIACLLLPRPTAGEHQLFTKHYYRALRLQMIHEIITGSSLLNNLVNRVEPLRAVVHPLLGLRKAGYGIVAPDVLILDPYMVRLGKRVFFGTRAALSPHIFVRGRMWIRPIDIGSDVLIGAGVFISCNVVLGDGVSLDAGVIVSHDCRIGAGSSILRMAFLGHGVEVQEGVRIGARSNIGHNVVLGRGSEVGRFCTVRSGEIVPPGTRLPEGSLFAGGEVITAPRSTSELSA